MTKAVDYGKELWLTLAPTFDVATSLDGFGGHPEKAQAFAGFIAAVAGTMCAQVGPEATRTALESVSKGVVDAARQQLQVVKP